jgi:hypothetical protein
VCIIIVVGRIALAESGYRERLVSRVVAAAQLRPLRERKREGRGAILVCVIYDAALSAQRKIRGKGESLFIFLASAGESNPK